MANTSPSAMLRARIDELKELQAVVTEEAEEAKSTGDTADEFELRHELKGVRNEVGRLQAELHLMEHPKKRWKHKKHLYERVECPCCHAKVPRHRLRSAKVDNDTTDTRMETC